MHSPLLAVAQRLVDSIELIVWGNETPSILDSKSNPRDVSRGTIRCRRNFLIDDCFPDLKFLDQTTPMLHLEVNRDQSYDELMC